MKGKTFWGQKYSAREIAEAKAREDIVLRWQKGEKLSRLMKDVGIKLTRAGWWLARRRYERDGFAGLLDRRSGRRSVIGKEVEVWVKEALEGRENLWRKELKEMLKAKFGLEISLSHISRLIRKVGIRRKRGGQKKEYTIDREKGIPIDHVGIYFLKGADSDMEGVRTITEGIVNGRKEEIEEKNALQRIRGTTPGTIRKKVETLLYLPMYDMQKPYHLLKYHKRGLGILTGSGTRYSYYTLDIFLCDIEKLKIAKEVGDALARCYLEALCIELELEDGSYFYIDGHAKHVWSSSNIPKAFFTTLKRAERGLHQYFIHSSKGDPLILLTCPGDTRLPGAIFNLIDAFENAVGKKILKAAIFDREGLSLSIFEEFDERKKYFITLLRENMYKGEESFKISKDFIPLKKVKEKDGSEKVTEWVAEGEYELKDREKKRKRIVRVALVKKTVNEKIKLIPIITNLTPREEPDIGRVARRYFDRWPNQENIFRDAIEAIKVDTNHGYKKEQVPNRVVQRKKEELEANLRGIEKKLKVVSKEREQVAKQLENLEGIYKDKKKILQKDKADLYAKIGFTEQVKERQKLLKDLRYIEGELTKMSEQYGRQLSELRTSLKNKERYEKCLRTQKENKENEIKSLNLEKALYEIKTEKDHLMSNFKMFLINLSSYTQRQYFPKEFHSLTMESMKKTFYQQDGYVKIGQKRIDVTLHSYDEPDLQKAVEYACMKFNNSDLMTLEGQRIWMHVEPAKCQFLNDN